MNMHVNFDAADYEQQHRAGNVSGSNRLLTMLMWHHPERTVFNPRLLPVAFNEVSPFLQAYQSLKRQKERAKWDADEKTTAFKATWFSFAPENSIPLPTISNIQRAVAKHYSVSRNDLVSERRTARVVGPRQVAMYLVKTLTPRSLPEIGRYFGGRDHTTVLHAVRKIEGKITTDPVLAGEVGRLKELFTHSEDVCQ